MENSLVIIPTYIETGYINEYDMILIYMYGEFWSYIARMEWMLKLMEIPKKFLVSIELVCDFKTWIEDVFSYFT